MERTPLTSRATGVRIITACGWAVLLLSAGSALLPALGPKSGAQVIGTLLMAAGLCELTAGYVRKDARGISILAGSLTAITGFGFLFGVAQQFLPTLYVIMGWLFMRSLILLGAAIASKSSVRLWTFLSAATDFLLAFLLLAGLSISTIIVGFFGPTEPLIASFAWILALSFVATGLLLLNVAACERALNCLQ